MLSTISQRNKGARRSRRLMGAASNGVGRSRDVVAKGTTPLEGLTVEGEAKPQTLESMVRQRLRREVLIGEFAPGAKLRILQLSTAYGVGASPVREALARLHAEGLVTAEDNKGFRVAPISLEDLTDLARARQVIDGEAFRLSIERGDTTWEAAVVGSFHRLARATRGGPGFVADVELWEIAHKSFHHALISACGSTTLLEIADRLYDRGARYRMLMAAISLPSDRLVKEHQLLVDTALARDPENGSALLRKHMNITAELIAGSLGKSPRAKPRRGRAVGK